jgi:large subunit ribosomal protein L6
MKIKIEKIVEIPEGYQIEVNGNEVSVKHNGKELKKEFSLPSSIKLSKDKDLKITAEKARKSEGKIIGTIAAHIRNMIKGLNEEYAYILELCTVHFPATIKAEGNKFVIKNFLGETVDRIAEIVPGAKVDIKGNIITVTSANKDAAGQTAANIEIATKIKYRDRRIFQDGIFLTERNGVKL